LAKVLVDISEGTKYSSRRISPGCTGSIPFVNLFAPWRYDVFVILDNLDETASRYSKKPLGASFLDAAKWRRKEIMVEVAGISNLHHHRFKLLNQQIMSA
jgi:hypothetical protein